MTSETANSWSFHIGARTAREMITWSLMPKQMSKLILQFPKPRLSLFLENLLPCNRNGRRAFIMSQGDDKGDVSCDVSYSPKCKFCRVRPHQQSSCSHTHTSCWHAEDENVNAGWRLQQERRKAFIQGGEQRGRVIMCESRWWRGWLRNNKWYQQQFLIDNPTEGQGLYIIYYSKCAPTKKIVNWVSTAVLVICYYSFQAI